MAHPPRSNREHFFYTSYMYIMYIKQTISFIKNNS